MQTKGAHADKRPLQKGAPILTKGALTDKELIQTRDPIRIKGPLWTIKGLYRQLGAPTDKEPL